MRQRQDKRSKDERNSVTATFSEHLATKLPELLARFQADSGRYAHLLFVNLIVHIEMPVVSGFLNWPKFLPISL